MTNYTVVRSKRKTVGIYIRNGNTEVRVPLKYPAAKIERFVKANEKWIENKLTVSREQLKERESFQLNYGDEIPLRGVLYPIKTGIGDKSGFGGDYFYVPRNLTPEQIKDRCVRIYCGLAAKYLPDRVQKYAALMNVSPSAVKVNKAKTRWGSCSSQKSINFSWRLVMADDETIDYVIVHELAHLIEMNHSQRFWSIVEAIIPDYRRFRAKLNDLQNYGVGW